MRNRFLGAVCILLLWGSCTARAELRAGVARVDITPKTHEPLSGFEDRTDPSTGTLDPLYARVLGAIAEEETVASVNSPEEFAEDPMASFAACLK